MISRQFVVARRDGLEVLAPTIASLDDIAPLVGFLVVTNAFLAFGSAWNDWPGGVLLR